MALVGYQRMLLGFKDGELVVELQIPSDLLLDREPTDAFAQAVMTHVGWKTKHQPDL